MLVDLPFELLAQIVSYLHEAHDLSSLALTCRRLNKFIEEEGWRVFTQEQFSSIETPKLWKDAARALTSYARNWDRRAVIARFVQPEGRILKWPEGTRERQWSPPKGQTMGFQPAIDSYQEWTGVTWSSRREVLAYSAGAELVLRVKESGPEAQLRQKASAEAGANDCTLDHHRNTIRWATYKPNDAAQGIDDITCLRLRRSRNDEGRDVADCESLVVGTASGDLTSLTVPLLGAEAAAVLSSPYDTDGRSVKSLDISEGPFPLLAACLSGTTIALYPLSFSESDAFGGQATRPINEIAAIPPAGVGPKQQVWTVRFLSPDRLAVGIGPSGSPLSVYHVGESGITEQPIRRFQCRVADRLNNGVDFRFRAPVTAAYHILPLSSFNAGNQQPGDVFLTGFHDGFVTLNDMRSPRDYVQTYRDPIDDSAIYSLAAIGRERFVAGSSRHSTVKFFDIRMSGGHAHYHSERLLPPARNAPQQQCATQERKSSLSPNAWNLFLNPRNEAHSVRQPWRGRQGERTRGRFLAQPQTADSPIYSLSSPSSCSPSLFAGIENHVVQIDMVSMMDQHPDPLFEQSVIRRPDTGDIDVRKTWDPTGNVLNLAMYEHNDEGGSGLMNQAGAGDTLKRDLWVEGYDERWRKGEKWKKDRAV